MSTYLNYVQKVSSTLAELLPDCDNDLLTLYTVLALTRGRETTLKDVHDAWSVWQCGINPAHRSLIPFDQLTPEVQGLDRPYRLAIRRAAEAVIAPESAPAATDLDLMEILGRAEASYAKVRDQFVDDDGLPLSVRKHFNEDVPALLGAVKRLTDELEHDRRELGRLRADAAVAPLVNAMEEADRILAKYDSPAQPAADRDGGGGPAARHGDLAVSQAYAAGAVQEGLDSRG